MDRRKQGDWTHTQRVLVTLLLLAQVFGCERTLPREAEARQEIEPVAWIQLDSTLLAVEEVINGLDQPRDISFGPDGSIWISEVTGQLIRSDPETGEKKVVFSVPDLFHERARGLLSAELHPDFESDPFVYFHYTYEREEMGSRLVRYRYDGETLVDPVVIEDPLPGGSGHSGSKLMIGPDRKLWLATGDASIGEKAQDWDDLNGKILRYNLDGTIPSDNPASGEPIWSVGHRNIQGITHDGERIFASEHGPSSDDEVNRIHKGANYGWPDVHGFCDNEDEQDYCASTDVTEPIHAFTPVVAAAGLGWYDHGAIPEWRSSLLLTSLRIQTLRVVSLEPGTETVSNVSIYLQQKVGRIRDLLVGMDGDVYLMTSNTDWYQHARADIHDPSLTVHGDKIFRLRPLDTHDPSERPKGVPLWKEDRIPLYLGDSPVTNSASDRERLYQVHCSSCHGTEGEGLDGMAPSLVKSPIVNGAVPDLLRSLLEGVDSSSAGEFEMAMPVFSHLDNEEVAAIASFVRMELAGQESGSTEAQVEAIRNEGSQSCQK
ncbi:MAG: PQQ-dependent sugar dehydrogenase [Balneolaceae bacterium]